MFVCKRDYKLAVFTLNCKQKDQTQELEQRVKTERKEGMSINWEGIRYDTISWQHCPFLSFSTSSYKPYKKYDYNSTLIQIS